MSSSPPKNNRNPDIRKIDLSLQKRYDLNPEKIKAEISKTWYKTLIGLSIILAFLSGLSAAYSGGLMGHIITNDADEFSIFSLPVIVIIALFIYITLSKGWGQTATDLATIIVTTLLLITITIAIIAFSPENIQGFNVALGANFTLLASLGMIAAIVNYAIAFTLSKIIFISYSTLIIISCNLLGTIICALCGVTETSGYMIAIIITSVTLILGTYVGRQTIKRKAKYRLLLWLSYTLTIIGKENFNTDEFINLSLDDPHHLNIAAIAIEQLREQYPLDFLEIKAINEQQLRLHARITKGNSLVQLSEIFNQIYHNLKVSPLSNHLDENNPTVRILKELLIKAIETPNNYIDAQGELKMTQGKGNVSISGTQGNVSGVAAAGENQTLTGVAMGETSGSVANTINQLPDHSNPNQPNLKDLLKQLQTAIENEKELDEDDKIQALEQVKTLAEASQNPQETKMQKLAKGARNTLKGIISGLPDAAKLVESVNQLLPTILKLFGL